MPSLIETLISDLTEEGAELTALRPGEWLLQAYAGESIDPPAVLRVDERHLTTLLGRWSGRAHSATEALWPDSSHAETAYRLLLSALEDGILKFDYRVATIDIDPKRGVIVAPRQTHREEEH